MDWAGTEFETIDLGDERLNERPIRFVERLSAQSMASVPQARRLGRRHGGIPVL